jgi:hypothetical protein
MYAKGYLQRIVPLIVAVCVTLMSALLCFILFGKRLDKISGQLNSYRSSDYSTIYVLNYGTGLNNECVFPDTDYQFYLDKDKKKRIAVTSVMMEKDANYSLSYLSSFSDLDNGEMAISHNVAEKYQISTGTIIFAEASYTVDMIPFRIVKEFNTEFDFARPNTDNDIGVVFLGFDERYVESISSDRVLYSHGSQAEALSSFPQVIKNVINKTDQQSYVTNQALAALIILTLFTVAAIVTCHILFYSDSVRLLRRCYLKGMPRHMVQTIPFVEKIVLSLIPCAIIQLIITLSIPSSSVMMAYRIIPVLLWGVYSLLSFGVDVVKGRAK